MKMETLLTQDPWPGLILWTLVYFSDYAMTIASARKYRSNPHLEFEGSYELTPQFEKDVDALKPISTRHLLFLLLTNLILLVLWWLFSLLGAARGFSLILGMFLLMEVGVHFRHYRTYHSLSLNESKGGLEGKISYRRWFLFSTSAFEFICFSALFLLTAVLTNSLFFLGGSIACLSLAINHHRRYRALYKQTITNPGNQT